jgi:hypothetical protein
LKSIPPMGDTRIGREGDAAAAVGHGVEQTVRHGPDEEERECAAVGAQCHGRRGRSAMVTAGWVKIVGINAP